MTLSKMTLRIKGLWATLSITKFSIMTLNITTLCHYAECPDADCRILHFIRC